MLPRTMRIKNLFPMVNGIFHHLNYTFPEVLSLTPEQLDIIWCTNYGMRLAAPVVLVVHDDAESQVLTSEELSQLSQLILAMYKYKWDRLGNLLSLEYDPIHNYSDDVHEETTEQIDRTEELTHGTTVQTTGQSSGTETLTDSGSERTVTTETNSSTRTDNLQEHTTGAVNNDIYGFNSDQAVGDNTSDSDNTRTNTGTQGNSGQSSKESTTYGGLVHTTQKSGTTSESQGTTGTDLTEVSDDTQGSNESTTYGGLIHTTQKTGTTSETQGTTGSDTTEEGSNRTRIRDLTHLGNIGNLTTQQLMTQEIELWRWNYIQEILNDVKDFLTIPVYD